MPDLSLFLDTCALLYLVSGSDRLSSHAKDMIDNALIVLVSPISAWEVSLKHVRNQVVLPKDPDIWFAEALANHNLRLSSLSVEVMLRANKLPWHHKDPADRFIIASAELAKATVVTTDSAIRMYGIPVIS